MVGRRLASKSLRCKPSIIRLLYTMRPIVTYRATPKASQTLIELHLSKLERLEVMLELTPLHIVNNQTA